MRRLMDKKELSAYLGLSCHTINLWISKKKIPYLKLGTARNALVRFSIEEVEEWLKNLKEKNLSKGEQTRD